MVLKIMTDPDYSPAPPPQSHEIKRATNALVARGLAALIQQPAYRILPDGDKELLLLLSINPQLPDKLRELIAITEKFDDCNIAKILIPLNKNAHPALLMKLISDPNDAVRGRVASNPSTPVLALQGFAFDSDDGVRWWLAKNTAAPPEILSKLSTDVSDHVRANVASNINTPTCILEEMASSDNTYKLNFLSNLSTPNHICYKIISNNPLLLQLQEYREAGNPKTHPEKLAQIALRASSEFLLAAQERLRSTPMALLYSSSAYRLNAVASNPSTPPEVLIRFSENSSYSIHNNLAQNPALPRIASLKLMTDANWSVRSELAKNPSTPPDVLAHLARDSEKYVRQCVSLNARTPAESLGELSNDTELEVWLATATNPNLPETILARFAKQAGIIGWPIS